MADIRRRVNNLLKQFDVKGPHPVTAYTLPESHL
jgi:hypothetical protein